MIIQVGHLIGPWWTIFALIAETVVGAWLVRREGRRAWRTLVEQLSEGQAPTKAAVDGAVILLGGVLLLTPGFVTDFFGFLCVLPPTRPLDPTGGDRPSQAPVTRAVTSCRAGTEAGPELCMNVIEGHLADPDDRR